MQQLRPAAGGGGDRFERRQTGGDEQGHLFVQRVSRNEKLIRGVRAGGNRAAGAFVLAYELILLPAGAPKCREVARAPAGTAQQARDATDALRIVGHILPPKAPPQNRIVEPP